MNCKIQRAYALMKRQISTEAAQHLSGRTLYQQAKPVLHLPFFRLFPEAKERLRHDDKPQVEL